MKKVLFVCLGNICRSPTAEAITKSQLKNQGLDGKVFVDSCGTIDWHRGNPADSRTINSAALRGYSVTSISRPLIQSDFQEFDFIFTMDETNYSHVLERASSEKEKRKVFPVTDFCTKRNVKYVPDPYKKGPEGFEEVLDILEDCCGEIVKRLENQTLDNSFS